MANDERVNVVPGPGLSLISSRIRPSLSMTNTRSVITLDAGDICDTKIPYPPHACCNWAAEPVRNSQFGTASRPSARG